MTTGSNISNLPAFRADLERSIARLPAIAGAAAVSFFKGNFRRQGWTENGQVQPWAKRKAGAKRNKGRAILVDTGRLRRDIRVLTQTRDNVAVGSTLPYAAMHNEGGTFNGTVAVPGFTRKASKVRGFRRNGRKVRAHQRSAAKVSSHTRQMNLTIPQRRFIGESPDVMKTVERAFIRELESSIGKYLSK